VKRGIDTNVLIYAHLPALAEHAAVRRFLLDQLGQPGVTLVVTPLILHEFVHVITDPRRFDPPVPMAEALSLARRYLGRSNVECAAVDESAVRSALDLLERHGLGRKRIADALLAATLFRHGVRELITCNPSDFELFALFRLIDPRAA
jgi:predicted nucleic acid-binding protein